MLMFVKCFGGMNIYFLLHQNVVDNNLAGSRKWAEHQPIKKNS